MFPQPHTFPLRYTFLLLIFLYCTICAHLSSVIMSSDGTPYMYGTFYGADNALHRRIKGALETNGEWHVSIAKLISTFLDEDSLMFDVFPNSGITEISLGYLIRGCRFASITRTKSSHEALIRNSHENSIIDRSLLLFEPGPSEENLNTEKRFIKKERTVENVYNLLFKSCPAIIKFNCPPIDDSLSPDNCMGKILLNALIQSLGVINLCNPVIYIDNNYMALSYPLTSIISALPGYSLYWHISDSIEIKIPHDCEGSHQLISILAVHESRSMYLSKDFDIFPFDDGKHFLSEYDRPTGSCNNQNEPNATDLCLNCSNNLEYEKSSSHSISKQSCKSFLFSNPKASDVTDLDPVQWNVPTVFLPIAMGAILEDIIIPLDVIRDINTVEYHNANHCNHSELNAAGMKCDAEESSESLVIVARVPSQGEENYFNGIAEGRCTIWILRLIRINIISYSDSIEGYPDIPHFAEDHDDDDDDDQPLISRRAAETIRSCTEFAVKRFELLQLSSLHSVTWKEEQRRGRDRVDNSATETTVSSAAAPSSSSQDQFDPLNSVPFLVNYSESHCGDPVWCGHSRELQRRLQAWQTPDSAEVIGQQENSKKMKNTHKFTQLHDNANGDEPLDSAYFSSQSSVKRPCDGSKFLLFEPPSGIHGLGSMLHLAVGAFRLSLCLGRVFILLPQGEDKTLTKWKHPGCRGSTFECYFKRVSGCLLTPIDLLYAINVTDATYIHESPYKEERVLRLLDYPGGNSICRLCGDGWTGDLSIFDGLHQGDTGYFFRDKEHADSAWRDLDKRTQHMLHFSAFKGTERQYWTSLFMRYLLRPRAWFQQALQRTTTLSLTTHTTGMGSEPRPPNNPHSNSSKIEDTAIAVSVGQIPKPYLSLHVRYGSKVLETASQPLDKYMTLVKRKYPYIKTIFVSTETQAVLLSLVREYPEYHFYFLSYKRVEHLDLTAVESVTEEADYVRELLYAFANLYVAVDGADFFLGSLTSSWCATINVMQRTRGDGGSDYLSVDGGSAHTACF